MITALGFSTAEHWEQINNGRSGLKLQEDTSYLNEPFCAALVDKNLLAEHYGSLGISEPKTILEKLFLTSIIKANEQADLRLSDARTLFIFTTTKGNIDLLENPYSFPKNRLRLGKMAEAITRHFGNPNRPVVVSNACISGVMGIIMASRFLRMGQFDHIVVTGGDLVTKFTLSGFQALKAMSNEPCKPFDAARRGINLGEGVGTMILSVEPQNSQGIAILGGAISNDANHISGPSRTGEGLQLAIKNALKENVATNTIDYISAHGTATVFNDEMEAKAFHALHLDKVPVNSFKGYWGHTLGAAGILESILAYKSLINNQLLHSQGFSENGVSVPLNIIQKTKKADLKTALKTSSGFGGCNAAVVFQKI